MVYIQDLQQYAQESALLISARPATTRITTRYSILPASKLRQRQAKKKAGTDAANDNAVSGTYSSQANITFKTYDPVSGVVLKYRTDRAAEIGRLMTGLSRCGTVMAAVPEGERERLEAAGDAGKGKDAELANVVAPAAQDRPEEKSGTQSHGKASAPGKKRKKR